MKESRVSYLYTEMMKLAESESVEDSLAALYAIHATLHFKKTLEDGKDNQQKTLLAALNPTNKGH